MTYIDDPDDGETGETPVKSAEDLVERYPFKVELRFRSETQKREFMGQLSDGWGENQVDLEWPWEQYANDDGDCGDAFDEQPAFGVELLGFDEDYEDDEDPP